MPFNLVMILIFTMKTMAMTNASACFSPDLVKRNNCAAPLTGKCLIPIFSCILL